MSSFNCFGRLLGISAFALLVSSAAHAAVSTADSVLQYDGGADLPSSYWGAPYNQTSAALGLPDASINLAEDDDAGIYPDDSYVSPFNAEYNPANIVAIAGSGGYIELHMSQPVSTNGFTLGVHSGVGLEDTTGNGDNSNPAETYTNPRSATVLVSSDGSNWVSLGSVDFDNPTNIYTDISGPYAETPGSQLANFAQPFLGDLSSFDGQSFAGTLSVLNGSAGGTWLDLSGTGLSQVSDIAFETDPGQTMFIDSVVGIPAPEPASLALLIFPALFLKRVRH